MCEDFKAKSLNHLDRIRRRIETGEIVGLMTFATSAAQDVYQTSCGRIIGEAVCCSLQVAQLEMLRSIADETEHDDGTPDLLAVDEEPEVGV